MKRFQVFLLCLLISPVYATQLYDGNPEETIKATASLSDPNIITIDGGSIESVWGTEDKVSLEANQDTGQVIFRPVSKQRFTLFVQSISGATYTLSITPKKELIGQSIVISESIQASRSIENHYSKADLLKNKVSGLLKSIEAQPGTHRIPGFRLASINKEIPLWQETQILHSVTWKNRNLVIDKYVLTNISDAPLVVEEREFRHLQRHIRAISIRDHRLEPAQSTVIYTFRSPS